MDKTYKDFPITKNLNGSYNITAVFDGQELPYNVCKNDAGCKFDYEEVAAYWDSLDDGDAKKLTEKEVVIPEPTAEEKAAAEKAKLASEYEANKSEMLNALQSATLAGNTDAVASIQQDYKDMTAAYKEAVEGVTTA